MIHGLLLVDKPSKMTSHDVVKRIRHMFKVKKVGHFGTLDPNAVGLLLIGMGHATKFFDFYIKKRKLYSGVITFGHATDTYDSEGEPVSEDRPVDLRTLDIPALLAGFRGKQMQLPPIYSAKKYKGRPMYKYARENKPVERKPAEVEIYSLEAEVLDERHLRFRAETSSGTYIRTLAHDMGQHVGVGAYLEELKREGVGEFGLEHAFTLEDLELHAKSGEVSRVVTPIEALLPEFSKIIVSPGGRKTVVNGMPLLPRDVMKIIQGEDQDNFRLFDDEGKLLAIARKDPHLMRFRPYIVFT